MALREAICSAEAPFNSSRWHSLLHPLSNVSQLNMIPVRINGVHARILWQSTRSPKKSYAASFHVVTCGWFIQLSPPICIGYKSPTEFCNNKRILSRFPFSSLPHSIDLLCFPAFFTGLRSCSRYLFSFDLTNLNSNGIHESSPWKFLRADRRWPILCATVAVLLICIAPTCHTRDRPCATRSLR